jgi:hypothetical protein
MLQHSATFSHSKAASVRLQGIPCMFLSEGLRIRRILILFILFVYFLLVLRCLFPSILSLTHSASIRFQPLPIRSPMIRAASRSLCLSSHKPSLRTRAVCRMNVVVGYRFGVIILFVVVGCACRMNVVIGYRFGVIICLWFLFFYYLFALFFAIYDFSIVVLSLRCRNFLELIYVFMSF